MFNFFGINLDKTFQDVDKAIKDFTGQTNSKAQSESTIDKSEKSIEEPAITKTSDYSVNDNKDQVIEMLEKVINQPKEFCEKALDSYQNTMIYSDAKIIDDSILTVLIENKNPIDKTQNQSQKLTEQTSEISTDQYDKISQIRESYTKYLVENQEHRDNHHYLAEHRVKAIESIDRNLLTDSEKAKAKQNLKTFEAQTLDHQVAQVTSPTGILGVTSTVTDMATSSKTSSFMGKFQSLSRVFQNFFINDSSNDDLMKVISDQRGVFKEKQELKAKEAKSIRDQLNQIGKKLSQPSTTKSSRQNPTKSRSSSTSFSL